MMAELSICAIRPQDQQIAKDLVLEGLKEHWHVWDETKNPDLNDIVSSYADGVFLLGWQDGVIVGTGALRPVSDTTAEIVRMSVRKKMRRHGVGRAILRALCWQAYHYGYTKIILETTTTWTGVIAFYRAFGFEITHQVAGDSYFALSLQTFIDRERGVPSNDEVLMCA